MRHKARNVTCDLLLAVLIEASQKNVLLFSPETAEANGFLI